MIPIVEDYLSDLLQNKFSYIRSNPNQLNRILNTSQDRINQLAIYLKDTKINIVKGYPRLPSQLPCVCIILSGEEENQEGLGDYGEDDDSNIQSHSEVLVVKNTRDGVLCTPYVKISHIPLESISHIDHNDYSITLDSLDYEVINPYLGIIEFPMSNVDADDSVTVHYNFRASSTELTQVLYESNYRLESWTTNGDLTVELYHLVKWALLSGRDHLGKDKDLFRQKLGGSDFEPATSYFPEFVYRRALSFWCQFTASSPMDEVEYISEVNVNQELYSNTDGGD